MTERFIDKELVASERLWWEKKSRSSSDLFELDGYGQVAIAGGDALRQALVEDIIRKLDLSPANTLLEVGCGAGAMTKDLAPHVRRTVGADFSVGMLKHARQSVTACDFVAAEGSRLPFPSASFQRVLCYSVFNNFPSLAYAEAALRELIRVAEPGAKILVGQVPDVARRRDWIRAYADRFGGRPQSALRSWLGATSQVLRRLGKVTLALLRRPRSAATQLTYYHPEFFQRIAADTGHACAIMPGRDLLSPPDVQAYYDYRFDVRIEIGSR